MAARATPIEKAIATWIVPGLVLVTVGGLIVYLVYAAFRMFGETVEEAAGAAAEAAGEAFWPDTPGVVEDASEAAEDVLGADPLGAMVDQWSLGPVGWIETAWDYWTEE